MLMLPSCRDWLHMEKKRLLCGLSLNSKVWQHILLRDLCWCSQWEHSCYKRDAPKRDCYKRDCYKRDAHSCYKRDAPIKEHSCYKQDARCTPSFDEQDRWKVTLSLAKHTIQWTAEFSEKSYSNPNNTHDPNNSRAQLEKVTLFLTIHTIQ